MARQDLETIAARCSCTNKIQCKTHKNRRKTITRPILMAVPSKWAVQQAPRCDESDLCAQIVHLLNFWNLDHSFCAFIPSRVGRSSGVNAAVNALIHAQQYRANPHDESGALQSYFHSYGQAVNSAKKALQSQQERFTDELLLTVSLLSLSDSASGQNQRAALTHAEGVIAILRARPSVFATTDLARAIAYGTYENTFVRPCALGIASPFDVEHLRDLKPATVATLSSDIFELRWFSYRISVRLPRLIAQLRTLRSKATSLAPDEYLDVVFRAKSVLQLEAREAENKALHRVHVVKSEEPGSHAVVPYSFHYQSFEDMAACVLYWQARLHVIRISLAILRICPDFLEKDEVELLDSDRLRMATNIMMSWEWAHARPQMGLTTVTPLLIIWGALMGEETFRGEPVEKARTWLFERMPHVTGIWTPKQRSEDLDTACELFAGGPLKGFMAAAYRDEKEIWYAG